MNNAEEIRWFWLRASNPQSIAPSLILSRLSLLLYQHTFNISIAHRIQNPLRRTSEHIAIIYFQTNLYITYNLYGKVYEL